MQLLREKARGLLWAEDWEGSFRSWGSSSAGVKSHCWAIQPRVYSLEAEGSFRQERGLFQVLSVSVQSISQGLLIL